MNNPATLATNALRQVAKLIDKLTPEQLTELAEGRARIFFQSEDVILPATGRKPSSTRTRKPRASTEEIANTLTAMTDRDEAQKYLTEFTIDDLKAVADKLGRDVRGARPKANLVRRLVEGTFGARTRHEAIMGGAYRQ